MRNYEFNYDNYLKVVEVFDTNNDNSTENVSLILGLGETEVNRLINVYLSLKRNYMGNPVKAPQSTWKFKCSKRIRVTENGKDIGIYSSKKECSESLNVEVKSRYPLNSLTVNHLKLGRKLTYEYID